MKRPPARLPLPTMSPLPLPLPLPLSSASSMTDPVGAPASDEDMRSIRDGSTTSERPPPGNEPDAPKDPDSAEPDPTWECGAPEADTDADAARGRSVGPAELPVRALALAGAGAGTGASPDGFFDTDNGTAAPPSPELADAGEAVILTDEGVIR